MQTQQNKSKKIIMETRQEHKANKTSFAILPISSAKFYIKLFSDIANENTLKP